MTPHEMYAKVDALKDQLDKLKPLKPDDEDRLWKKFRLEWNYNSNHMEGNTLTYPHTELLLIFDRITGDYTGREIEEMKAHDVAIKMVDELAADNERDLTESFIRLMNQKLLVRPFWKDASTPDDQKTRREIIPGNYKEFPNSVKLENGEMFHYASPEETPAKMHDLMEFYKINSASTEVHPVWLAAMLHYKFVLIHPFDDGNGRIARLLMNFVLIKNGYPPVIIKDLEKKKYLTALNKADTGDMESFVNYIGEQLEWSLNISIDAANGKNIDEPNDLDKEIDLLKRKLSGDNILNSESTIENIFQAIKFNIFPLFKLAEEKSGSFKEYFFDFNRTIQIRYEGENSDSQIGTKESDLDLLELKWLENKVKVGNQKIQNLSYRYSLNGYKKNVSGYSESIDIRVNFNQYNYTIQVGLNAKQNLVPYGKIFIKEEFIELIKPELRKFMESIKRYHEN